MNEYLQAVLNQIANTQWTPLMIFESTCCVLLFLAAFALAVFSLYRAVFGRPLRIQTKRKNGE